MRRLLLHLAGIGFLGLATPATASHFHVQIDPMTGKVIVVFTTDVSNRSQQGSQLAPEPTAAVIAQIFSDYSELIRTGEGNPPSLEDLAAVVDRALGGSAAPQMLGKDKENLVSLVNEIIQAAVSKIDLNERDFPKVLDRDLPESRPSPDEQQLERERERQQAREQQRQSVREQSPESIARREERQQQQEEADRRAEEEASQQARDEQLRETREALRQRQADAGQDQDSSRQIKTRADSADDPTLRLRERLLASGGPAPDLDPNAPVTPESFQEHLNSLSGTGGSAVADGSGTGPVSREAFANRSGAGDAPGEVHTDYASEARQDRVVASAADDYLASEPDPETLWASYLANSGGPYAEEFPTESIYGEAVGIYKGLVRGSFEDGPSANGTIQMNISFTDYRADGFIQFDNNQGTMRFDGGVGNIGFELNMTGDAFGGNAWGVLEGWLYGSKGQEIGGDWRLYVSEDEFNERFASGKFAAKQ